jgi:amidase
MGACDFALGGDTGGSVRVPAALCGLYGIRTTLGRFDGTGTLPMAPTFDSFGWFSQGPGMLRLVGQVLLPDISSPIGVHRLLVASDAWREADAGVADVLRAFLGRTDALLPGVEEVTLTPDAFVAARAAFRTLQAYETWGTFGTWITASNPPLGPGIRERMEYAATVTAEEANSARAYVMDFRSRMRALVEPGTIVCLPTAPCISPEVDADPDVLDAFRTRTMALTCTAGLAGLPQITLPVGTVDGCPIGLSFIGWANSDESLLDLAVALGPYCSD